MKTLLDKERLVSNPPSLGCVLCLPGLPGGGNRIHDRSPYGNTGTITGAIWKRLPSGLWYLSFDGNDDYVDCGNDASLQITGKAITVEFWAAVTTMAAGDIWRTLISKGDYSRVSLHINRNLSGLTFGVVSGTTSYTAVYGSSLVSGQWYHIVGNYDGAHVNIHVNDVKTEGDALTGNIDSVADNWSIGAYLSYGRQVQADIALPRIYNRAFSTLEIQNRFRQEKHLFGVWQS